MHGERKDPIRDDLNTLIVASIAIGIVCAFALVGLYLKHDRKHRTVSKPVPYGCYVWSDGVEQCARGANGAVVRID